jgi:NAD+ synthetase
MLALPMRVALAQINTTIGAYAGNAAKVVEWTARAADRGADLVLFPELTVNGYPPGDLIEVSDFVAEGEEALHELALRLKGAPATVVGFVESSPHATGLGRSNSLAWIEGGAVRVVGRKSLLPNYDVFDERRYFDPADSRTLVERGGVKIGLSICEDLWNDERFWPRRLYPFDPVSELTTKGATWVLNASASPYEMGKPKLRRAMIAAAAQHHGVGVVYCNLVGGNDSLVFDGHSMVVDPAGRLVAHARGFEEELLVADLPAASARPLREAEVPPEHDLEQVMQALVLGLRDYMRKTGFERAVLGLSGGVDSALVAVIAARAVGAANVLSVAMPSRFTSSASDEDAATLARRLGIGFDVIPIEPVVDGLRKALSPVLGSDHRGVTDENLQARARGTLLMAISNKLGHLLLATGNKSELSVGYCTLYGDLCGGLAVIGDAPKTLVWRLAEHVNRAGDVIPRRTIERPPSAELRENQKDEDSLPPYPVLDRVLQDLVVERLGLKEQVARGSAEGLVREVRGLLLGAEFKRRQAPPVLKVTPKAFGSGWRFPIAHRFGRRR